MKLFIKCPSCDKLYYYDKAHTKSANNQLIILLNNFYNHINITRDEYVLFTFKQCGHTFLVINKKFIPISNEQIISIENNGLKEVESRKSIEISNHHIDQLILYFSLFEGKLWGIKFYKTFYGSSLKLAKEHVEQLLKSKGLNSKEGCFIATVCYGDYNAEEVIILRKFRDDVLIKKTWGRLMIKTYYTFSTSLAYKLYSSNQLKKIIRNYLLRYLVMMVHHKNKGA